MPKINKKKLFAINLIKINNANLKYLSIKTKIYKNNLFNYEGFSNAKFIILYFLLFLICFKFFSNTKKVLFKNM